MIETDLKIEDIIEKEGIYSCLTKGTSMQPFIVSGRDTVCLVKPKEKFSFGDIVLYKTKEKYILHRVIGFKKNGSLVIRGDNTYRKEYKAPSEIIAVCEGIYRNEKYILCSDFRCRESARMRYITFPLRLMKYNSRKILSKIYHRIFGKKDNEKI